MPHDFDDLLAIVGNDGPYQLRLLIMIIMPTAFLTGFTLNMLFFQTAVPEHWCHVPGHENTTLTPDEWKNLTIPREDGVISSCSRYSLDWTMEDEDRPFVISNETQGCIDGWDHDTSEFTTTLATSLEWFCDSGDYSTHILSIYLAGNAVGTMILPLIADKYFGRRLIYYVSLALHVVFTLPLLWAPYYHVHLVFRFLSGMAFQTNWQIPLVIVLEIISPDKRALASLLSFISWTVGMCLTSLVAWLLPYWRYIAFISCIPSALGFFYWRVLPESPRWLLSKGKIRECAQILSQIAKTNSMSEITLAELETQLIRLKRFQVEEESLTAILRYPKLRFRACIFIIIFPCMYLVYGIVLLSINVLPSNFFISHVVLSLFEFPSNLSAWLFTHYLGRRFTCIFTLILTATFSMAAPFCLEDEWTLLIIVGFIKLFTTQLLYIVIVLCNEVFPTPIRSTAFAWMTVIGFCVTAAAPYVLRSGYGSDFPFWVMLGAMLLSLVASLPLPETIGLPLPQTFEESEALAADRPLSTWIHHWNHYKYPGLQKADPKQDFKVLDFSEKKV